jgi:hypothetical protein
VKQVTTLHDILFVRPDAFSAAEPLNANTAWLAETSRSLRESAAVLAPSRWLADLAASFVPGLAVDVVPMGSEVGLPTSPRPAVPPRREFEAHRPQRVVALLGALGPHKGSDIVDTVANRLSGTGIGLVVVGYLDRQLHPGWRIPQQLFVHGAYAEKEAPGLLHAYGADLVLLPNIVPESFSYSLSDAWAAGVPVLAAPAGALAERIGMHGGGWLLPEGFDAETVVVELCALAGGDMDAARRRVQSQLARPDASRIPPLDEMIRSLDAYYTRFGIDPKAPGSANERGIESLLAKNLDGALFRVELVRLADELSQTLAALEETKRRGETFESDARHWIAKLEGDIAAVQEDLRRSTEEGAIERARLEREVDDLRLQKEALDRLPSPLRRLLLKLAFDARR